MRRMRCVLSNGSDIFCSVFVEEILLFWYYNNRRGLGQSPIRPAKSGAHAADAARCACYTISTRLRPGSAAGAALKPLLRFLIWYNNRRENSFAVFGRLLAAMP